MLSSAEMYQFLFHWFQMSEKHGGGNFTRRFCFCLAGVFFGVILAFLFLFSVCHADVIPFELKGETLYYSLDKGFIYARDGVTITFGAFVIAARKCSIDLKKDELVAGEFVVVIDADGQLRKGATLVFDCRTFRGHLLSSENVSFSVDEQGRMIFDGEDKSLFQGEMAYSAESLKTSEIYVKAERIHYYPNRLVRFWKGTLYFEGEEGDSIPYFSHKIGSLPHLNGLTLKYIRLRSSSGLDLTAGYNYLISDDIFGQFYAGISRFNPFDGESQDDVGIFGHDHQFNFGEGLLRFNQSYRTDNEYEARFHFSNPSFDCGSWRSDLVYRHSDRDFFRNFLSLENVFNWKNGRSLRVSSNSTLSTEFETKMAYREKILDSLFGNLDLSYYSLNGSRGTDDYRRLGGSAEVEWKPHYIFTGLKYSREQYFPDSFRDEEVTFHLTTKPLRSSDGIITFQVSNHFSLKTLTEEIQRELYSDTVSTLLRTNSLAFTQHTFAEFEGGLTYHWERDLQQVAYLDFQGLLYHQFTEYFQSGLQYHFLSRRDAESPWLVNGYATQTASLYFSIWKEQSSYLGVSCSYDITGDEFSSAVSRGRINITQYFGLEVLGEYNFFLDDVTRGDLILVRDLHFSELRFVYRIPDEAFYVEYNSKF